MTYEAIIYACLLALTGALIVWILPLTVLAIVESIGHALRARAEPRTPGRAAGSSSALSSFRMRLRAPFAR